MTKIKTDLLRQLVTQIPQSRPVSQASSQTPSQMLSQVSNWTRRAWLTSSGAALWAAAYAPTYALRLAPSLGTKRSSLLPGVDQLSDRIDPSTAESLAKQAVEAAKAAGAQYTDARLTRVVQHSYYVGGTGEFRPGGGTRPGIGRGHGSDLTSDREVRGVGVRVLVNGYWGFSASPVWEPDEVVRLAKDAVSQARENALGTPRSVDLGSVPAVTGRWSTPVRIDPFTIPHTEKQDAIEYWSDYCRQIGLGGFDPIRSWYQFVRQERVLATSDGTCVTQTLYESGGRLVPPSNIDVRGIDPSGKGWEVFLDAKIPEQLDRIKEELLANQGIGGGIASIGRYTLVCDGATMASIVEQTFGMATQLDRALGYEANGNGTSYIDDPLSMVGNLKVASSNVTVTANRSAPGGLATVKWDEEGVVPESCTLVKNGILNDFQTNREQAGWLAPYYSKHGRPVRSHGYASSDDALSITMQHMPNLAMEPSPASASIGLDDLVANVSDGLLLTNWTASSDHQARNGYLEAGMRGMCRKIKNGRLDKWLGGKGVVIQFNTNDLWQHVVALGGASTQGEIAFSQHGFIMPFFNMANTKGQPPQQASHTVRGIAATIPNQPLIMLDRS